MSDQFLGEIRLFAGNFAPRGWHLCDGTVMPINQNTALFSLLDVNYGGNGTTTFALPDLRGRVAIGTGQGPGLSNRSVGQQVGAVSATLTVGQLPPHTHTAATGTLALAASSARGNVQSPAGAVPAAEAAGVTATYSAGPSDTTMAAAALTGAPALASTGGGQPVSVEQPYLVVTYIIALQGIFPARN
jgi:microcystin-dependent protein